MWRISHLLRNFLMVQNKEICQSFKLLCLMLSKQDTLRHAFFFFFLNFRVNSSDRASLYEFICILVSCKVHRINLSLELPFLSDHRLKHIPPTLSFSGNEYIVQMVYLMPKDSRNNVKLWSLTILFFLLILLQV